MEDKTSQPETFEPSKQSEEVEEATSNCRVTQSDRFIGQVLLLTDKDISESQSDIVD